MKDGDDNCRSIMTIMIRMIKVTVKNHEKQKKAFTQAQGSSLECSGR